MKGAGHTSRQHRIQQQNPPLLYILGQLTIKQLRLTSLLIALNQNLANPHTPTTLSEGLLHRLAGTHDGDAANFALKLDAGVGAADGGGDGVREDGEVVQRFFHEEAVDAVAVEDEVRAGRAFVADHAVVVGV